MIRSFTGVGFVALFSGAVFGQTAITDSGTSAPAFEAADVHVSAKVRTPSMAAGGLRGTRYLVRQATMVDLISLAYDIDNDKILAGPSWLDTDRFDVSARAPSGSTPEQAKLMLQRLLAERFSLKFHKDSKELPGFVLSMGSSGKPKMKPAADAAASPNCQGQPQTPSPDAVPQQVVDCHSLSMEDVSRILVNMANASGSALDKTGLEGKWDFTIKWTPAALLARAGADGISIFDAVDKQLGLKLQAGKIPQPVIFVESVNEAPTPNAADIAKFMPPPPALEFEVAVIKPTNPDFKGTRMQILSDRINIQGATLSILLQNFYDVTPDMMQGPKFMDEDRWDITAKMISTDPGQPPQADPETRTKLITKLLEDRFQLKMHFEDRVVPAYTLSSVKPKMAKADPTTRTGCYEGPGPDGKDPRVANPVLSRLLYCRNMTMAQFADQLPQVANGYVHSAVLDKTGLTDAYDFTLSFSGIGLLRNAQAPAQPGAGGAADPIDVISLPDAVSKQLGLKLELEKRPAPVLVIDHVERQPTDN
jgi:uncharacterized protein (TIGR03435 family)